MNFRKICDKCGTGYQAKAASKRNCPIFGCGGNLRVIRLSPAQLKVVQWLRDGRILHHLSGLYPRAFMSSQLGRHETVSMATFLYLRDNGWLEEREAKHLSLGASYDLSEWGRKALAWMEKNI